jgi:nitrogen fixation-related uncharacterized protein
MSVIFYYLHQYSCRGIFLCILVGKSGQYDDDYTPSVECYSTTNSRLTERNTNNRRKTQLIMEMQQFYYDNKIVKKFIYATIVFGIAE